MWQRETKTYTEIKTYFEMENKLSPLCVYDRGQFD